MLTAIITKENIPKKINGVESSEDVYGFSTRSLLQHLLGGQHLKLIN